MSKSLEEKQNERMAQENREKIERKIECPRCKSLEFNYVEYKDGRRMIVSPCGWELVELSGPGDDMDVADEEDW